MTAVSKPGQIFSTNSAFTPYKPDLSVCSKVAADSKAKHRVNSKFSSLKIELPQKGCSTLQEASTQQRSLILRNYDIAIKALNFELDQGSVISVTKLDAYFKDLWQASQYISESCSLSPQNTDYSNLQESCGWLLVRISSLMAKITFGK